MKAQVFGSFAVIPTCRVVDNPPESVTVTDKVVVSTKLIGIVTGPKI